MLKTPSEFYTVREIAELTNGKLMDKQTGNIGISSIVIDSRKSKLGALFVPLKGERTDGHEFIKNAQTAGASCIFVAENRKNCIKDLITSGNTAFIIVDDPLRSLQQMAKNWVDRFPDLIKIGIVGSSGKTTTKELLKTILSVGNTVKANIGNLNSEIGLPLSLLSLRKGDSYGIFEMGINFKGEMDILSDIYRPQYVVVTNIGTAHSGPLGGEEGILKEKMRVFSCFHRESKAFLPEKGRYLTALKKASGNRFILYGKESQSQISDITNRGIDGWSFRYKGLPVSFILPGTHNLANMYAAVAVAEYFHIRPEDIQTGIELMAPLPGRSSIQKGRITVIEDSYNANADSVSGIVSYLNDLEWKGRKVIVLGAMKELGPDSDRLHLQVGKEISRMSIDALFLYGKETEVICSMIKTVSSGKECYYTESFEELKKNILTYVVPGDIVLLKGSRAMKLERLVELLQREEVPDYV